MANGTLQPAVLFGRLRHNMISVFVFFGEVLGWWDGHKRVRLALFEGAYDM